MLRPAWRHGAALGLALGVAGCGNPVVPMTDIGPVIATADNANNAVFEGQRSVVTLLSAPGADFTGATVVAADSALVVREFVCAGNRCGVVVEVPDVEPDAGRSIPSPIDSNNHYLRITGGSAEHRALFSVAPLDAIFNGGDMASVRGTYFAASVESVPTTVFRGAPGLEPVRWFVFGDATLRGTVDVSGGPMGPGPGGAPGTAIGATPAGAETGRNGDATGGAGGGGAGAPGETGAGAGAGEGGSAFALGCGPDGFTVACGGAGGGAADGAGGGGAGTFALIALGTLDVDADILATGGDGASGGGGGGGGRVFLSGTTTTGTARFDVSGGAGGMRAAGAGGAGGAGESRVESDGPTLDTLGELITRVASWSVAGTARPGATVRAENLGGAMLGEVTVGADGRFTLAITLAEGLNRIRVTEAVGGEVRRSWEGTSFELERRGAQLLPVGGLIDVVYVP